MIRKRIYNSIFKLNGHPIIAKPLKKFAESKVSKPLVGSFANVYKLDMDEADKQLADYQSLHHLFTRRLKEGVREVATAEDARSAWSHSADLRNTSRRVNRRVRNDFFGACILTSQVVA